METFKVVEHGGEFAMILPKDFRVQGDEVEVERQGDNLLVVAPKRQKPDFKTLNDVARYFAETYPDAPEFPDVERPKEHERPIPEW